MLKRNDIAPFDLLAFFEGHVLAQGIFEDRAGNDRRHFTADLRGTASASALTLEEAFVFEDGERQRRVWDLRRGPSLTFTGRCDDGIGVARGRFEPGKAHFASSLRLPWGSRNITLSFDDVFYDMGGGLVANRSRISKFNIRLGQVLMVLRKA